MQVCSNIALYTVGLPNRRVLMFVKRGGDADGKIMDVVDGDLLTEEQKKAIKKAIKETKTQTDTSIEKKSGS